MGYEKTSLSAEKISKNKDKKGPKIAMWASSLYTTLINGKF